MNSLLQDFYNTLSANGFLEEDSIQNLSDSSCNSTKQGIDFDKLKTRFCSLVKIPSLKSADVLIIDIAKQSLTFLEFKDIHKLILFNHNLTAKFKDFKLHDKIFDSYTLILTISGFYKIDHFTEFLNKTKIKINFLLVLNLSSRDYIKYRISNLVDVQSLEFRFLNKFNIIRSDELDKIF